MVVVVENATEYEQLLDDLCLLATEQKSSLLGHGRRRLVGIIGTPGAGKSTLAQRIANDVVHKTGDNTLIGSLPMDGFHYTRAQLAKFENPEEAIRRRGAPETFDSGLLERALENLTRQTQDTISWPSFDHQVKDPNENGYLISKVHYPLIIVEGNYLGLQQAPYKSDIAPFFDFFILVDCPERIAAERVCARHIKAGICDTEEAALLRWETNDGINAHLIKEHLPTNIKYMVKT